jgi:DNA-binding response OmpR family regulator
MEQPRVDTQNVRSLRPLRVLVVARDSRFNRVAGFLLARRGFEVETLQRPSAILDMVARAAIDVVILDASDSVSETARAVATLDALHPHITAIVVADEPAGLDGGNFRILSKWTSLETLVANLEAMHLGLETF